MNLIEKLGLEKCKQIVDGAPEWAVAVNMNNGMYYDKSEVSKGDIWLIDLRTQLSDYDRTDYVTDIRNHISPTTKVIER